MASALVTGMSSPGSRPGQGHCIMFSDKTLYSHSASLHLGVQMSSSKLMQGVTV